MPLPPVPPEELRWRCPGTSLDFATTADLRPAEGVVGQEDAVDSLRFGLSIDAPGQHVFVRGRSGTGRLSMVRDVLRTIVPSTPAPPDRAFVFDFDRPDQPRLVTLPAGEGPRLKARLEEHVRFVLEDLWDLVNTDSLRMRTHDLEVVADREVAEITEPFERALNEAGLELVGLQADDGSAEPALLPVIDGQATSFEELDERVRSGTFDGARAERMQADADRLEVQLEKVSAAVVRIRKRSQRTVRRLVQQEARRVLRDVVADVRRQHPEVSTWLEGLIEDSANHLPDFEEHPELADRYRVNVLVTRDASGPRPVVIENVPTVQNLLGAIDPAGGGDGTGTTPPHLGIHAGSLLRADGGTLVLQAKDLVSESGAWAALTRTLRTQQIELSPPEATSSTVRAQGVKPDPIPVRPKVVLIGEPELFFALDEADPDFSQLFKVLVDLDDTLPRDALGVALYGRVVARVVRDEGLLPFTSAAIGALVEHGARLAEESGKLSARFGRVADLARESSFLARGRGAPQVDASDVERAIVAARRRADLPGRRFRERMATGMIRIRTRGEEVGQVNGLAVVEAGMLVHGFPIRITATVGAGTAGTVHVEREAELSGQIHTKGFLIVRGLLRHLLRTPHPLVFDASITHEQSYGGVDGDSASGAEFCCLLSALTRIPVRQGVAMTGAVDQHGNVLPVGAVNEKIEGFFDACTASGLDGTQGVILPRANVGELQLRRDVVGACRAGRFSVWAVERIEQAVQLLLGMPAGEADAHGVFPEHTVLGRAAVRAEDLWAAAWPEKAKLAGGRARYPSA